MQLLCKLTLSLKILMVVQFNIRCGTSLFMNWKLSMERKLICHKNIDAPGHGKSIIDSEQGLMKNDLPKGLCDNVTSQPEAYIEGKNTSTYLC